MATDREIFKKMQAGQLNSLASSASNALAEIGKVHRKVYTGYKVGTENAATAVAETAMVHVQRQGTVKAVSFVNGTNIAANTTDYTVITVSKSTGGAASVPVATWNTAATAVGGAMTKWVKASFIVSPNADANVAADDVITYTIAKAGAGKAIDQGPFTLDVEET